MSSASRADADTSLILRRRERARVTFVLGLAVLVGLTSGAIASVSPWLVTIYATAMVLIFALPRTRTADDDHGTGCAEEDRGGAKVQAGNRERLRLQKDSRERSTLDDGASLEAPTGQTPHSVPPAAPTRRNRTRARKTVKPPSEPAPESSVAAWLQVAPGKFVRADAQPSAATATPEPHAPIEIADEPVNEPDREGDPGETAAVATFAPAETDFPGTSRDPEAEIPSDELVRVPDLVTAISESSDSRETQADRPGHAASPPPNVDSDAPLIQHHLRLVHATHQSSAGRRRSNRRQRLRNDSSGPRFRDSRRCGHGAGTRARVRSVTRSGRLSNSHRDFLPRSPPCRS